ncbi:hypothetical protein FLK61_31025 [Paenalkalicoccus suaedae]|uniref:Uncharacterized protein n=1 Tax=Paenalkalicoccus suaedae TaxID=2592382 RepID=A0A859FD51_9BACI|nr:hypothetical protein [Paenalkalicoccus suaedae]QKS71149.1 hypothetical protein FLK61_31025 [Paenalkalicoccus suaedae]
MSTLSWREKLLEHRFVTPFLPNYLKPLDDPTLVNEQTKEFVYEAEEFISDLAALSELPRLNKTFKRSIHGYSYKIKIKAKKIHLEMIDTQKSSSTIKKRLFITMFRRHIKQEGGIGKVADSTIYYQKNGRTSVRNVKRHPAFLSLFYHIHRLDLSISGEDIPDTAVLLEQHDSSKPQPLPEGEDQLALLKNHLADVQTRFASLDPSIEATLYQIKEAVDSYEEEFHLLDVEERHRLKRMILHDIPSTLQTYLSLSSEKQKESLPKIIQSFKNMHSFLLSQSRDLEKTRMDRMNHLLTLNDLRYKQSDNKGTSTSEMMRKHQKQFTDDM